VRRPTLLLALAALLLVAVTLAVYWPVAHYPFINYDDPRYVVENPHVATGLTWDNVKWAFTQSYASNWHPLTWISHMLDVQLFGMTPGWHHFINLIFHVINTLLLLFLLKQMTGSLWRSAAVAALFALHPLHVESVAWIAERKDVLSAFFFMLTLLSYARYAQARGDGTCCESRVPSSATQNGTRNTLHAPRSTLHAPRSTLFYALSLALFACGLMAKPMLVTLPFVLLLLDFWPLGRVRSQKSEVRGQASTIPHSALRTPHSDAPEPSTFNLQPSTAPLPSPIQHPVSSIQYLLLEKAPFLALSLASSIITYLAQRTAMAPPGALTFGDRLTNALLSYIRYLAKTLWPARLGLFYPLPAKEGPLSEGLPIEQALLAVVLLAAVSLFVLWQWRRRPWLAVGWFWFLGMLVPVIGLVQAGSQAMADRYTYLPLIGIFIVAVWSTAELLSDLPLPHPRPLPLPVSHSQREEEKEDEEDSRPLPCHPWLNFCVALAVLIPCALLTHTQVGYWRDDFALFNHTIAVTTDQNIPAHFVLGVAYGKASEYEHAITEFQAALQLDPDIADAHYHIGLCQMNLKKLDLAIEPYQAAIRLDPKHLQARSNLALCLIALGRRDEALEQYAALGQLEPASPVPHFCMGGILFGQRKFPEAAAEFAEAVRREPSHAEARTSLGRALALEGKTAEALEQFREVARLYPTNTDPQLYLADTLEQAGRTNEAEACFAEAARLNPSLAQTNVEQGKLLLARGLPEAALARFNVAAHLQPDNAEADENLGLLYSQQGKAGDAAQHYRAALRATPDAVGVLNNLAWLLATSPDAAVRNGAEAVTLAERACRLTENKQPVLIGTLAAAYAEAGRFADAVQTAEKARDLAQKLDLKDLADRNTQLLELYRAGKPYREK
jgi:tetratricopeptide (TPR) repeat protein